MAIKHNALPNDGACRKLLPAEVNVIPVVASRQNIPEVNFFFFTCPYATFDNFSCRVIMLHYPGSWIALTQRGISSLLNRSISGFFVPGRLQSFA